MEHEGRAGLFDSFGACYEICLIEPVQHPDGSFSRPSIRRRDIGTMSLAAMSQHRGSAYFDSVSTLLTLTPYSRPIDEMRELISKLEP